MFRNGYPRLRQEPVGEGLVGRDRPRGPFDKRGLLTKDPRYRARQPKLEDRWRKVVAQRELPKVGAELMRRPTPEVLGDA